MRKKSIKELIALTNSENELNNLTDDDIDYYVSIFKEDDKEKALTSLCNCKMCIRYRELHPEEVVAYRL